MPLLLTGATGLVGRLLLEQTQERSVIAISRQPVLLGGKVRTVIGDLSDPGFSLPDTLPEVTEIIHCAAAVRFDLPLADARAINTIATGKLLDFARRQPRLRKFTHVSTVYVMGDDEGMLPEEPYEASSYPNSYEQSKAEAEALVLKAGKDLPVQIVRLSSIAGNAQTGVVTQFNHLHQLLKLFPQQMLPIIPGHPDNPVDLIAEDWTVPALWHLHENAFRPGSIANLSAGPGASIRLADMLAVCSEVYDCPAPRMVSLEEFELYTQRHLGPLINRLMKALGLFLPHLGRRQTFLNAHALSRIPTPPPLVEDFLPAIVRYCALGGQLGAAAKLAKADSTVLGSCTTV
jgi:nucleoside-diphosphate-sugar epimerase